MTLVWKTRPGCGGRAPRAEVACPRCKGVGLKEGQKSRTLRSGADDADLALGVHSVRVMLAMRRDHSREAWWIRGMVIAVALLTLATGFCLFDQDDHGTAGQLPDLCLGMLAVSLTVIPFARLLAVGWTVSAPAVAAYVVARHIPDPPPRPTLFR